MCFVMVMVMVMAGVVFGLQCGGVYGGLGTGTGTEGGGRHRVSEAMNEQRGAVGDWLAGGTYTHLAMRISSPRR
jgi:hypothetical protein